MGCELSQVVSLVGEILNKCREFIGENYTH